MACVSRSAATLALFVAMLASFAFADVRPLGPDLFAYISSNDSSANSTFVVSDAGILVVDTGLNEVEGKKLLAEIRKISPSPIRWIVNTHYHPDHRGGNLVFGPDVTIISTPFTREQVLHERESASIKAAGLALNVTVKNRIVVFVGSHPVEIWHPGPAHTMGDLMVYFPDQRTLATGDLFLTNSCPAMDQGDMENWIKTLDSVLSLPVSHVVPGHFEAAGSIELRRFRDYLNDLGSQVRAMRSKGMSLAEIKLSISLPQYRDFRQFPQYEATFADNAEAYFNQLAARQ
jgi:cyclase